HDIADRAVDRGGPPGCAGILQLAGCVVPVPRAAAAVPVGAATSLATHYRALDGPCPRALRRGAAADRGAHPAQRAAVGGGGTGETSPHHRRAARLGSHPRRCPGRRGMDRRALARTATGTPAPPGTDGVPPRPRARLTANDGKHPHWTLRARRIPIAVVRRSRRDPT